MGLKITRVNLWAAEIGDQPGGLAEKLAALAQAGANLEFVFARRAAERPGAGVVFLSPLKGAAQLQAAGAQGFQVLNHIAAVRLEGSDAPGLGARVTERLAVKGINLRGFGATSHGRRCVIYLVFDCAADATAAIRALKARSW